MGGNRKELYIRSCFAGGADLVSPLEPILESRGVSCGAAVGGRQSLIYW